MDFELTDEQELIRDAVGKLCSDYPDEYWSKKDKDHEFPWDFYNDMAKAGWLGIAIPEAYGGSGQGITEASIVLETVAASGAAMNGATPLHLSIFGMEPVIKFGSEEMKHLKSGCGPSSTTSSKFFSKTFIQVCIRCTF